MTRVSRQALYEMIWKEPISKVSPGLGISDVGLSKICRKHGIPRPPRGYWAKLAAGKPVIKAPLTPRGLGMPREIELVYKNRWRYTRPSDPEKVEVPPPFEFQEPQSVLEKRVWKLVGKVTVPRDLSRAHHSIRKLLEKDDERRKAQEQSTYYSSFDSPLFDSPYEQRRLRLINAIIMNLGRNGVRASVTGKDPDSFGFTVGEQRLSFSLDHPDIERNGWRREDDKNRSTRLPMSLKIYWWKAPDDFKLSWTDEPGKKLERELKVIVVAMIVAGEMWYRLSEVRYRKNQTELRDRLIKEALQREEEESRHIEEERRQLEQAKIDRLIAESEALQQAKTIREYVAAVRVANANKDCPLSDSELSAWANHALAQANRIDPVESGAFLRTELEDEVVDSLGRGWRLSGDD